jgi:formylglycine-generating enzyme required for sulfatase activity
MWARDIAATLIGAGQFTTLVAAIQAAGLVDTLKGPGPFTVFAPTDAAFAALPAGTVEDLLKPENKAKLTAILTYHVLPAEVLSSAFVGGAFDSATVQGATIKLDGTTLGLIKVDDANVVAADIDASNGVIHVIDKVLLPPIDAPPSPDFLFSQSPLPTPSITLALSASVFKDCADCPEMVTIPAGTFLMGSPDGEVGRLRNEGPQRRVTVPAFAAGRYEVTWEQYETCVRAGICSAAENDRFGRGSRPVTNVMWHEAKTYAAWLSQKTGQLYRLLSEAEWEYAARAGSVSRWSAGYDENAMKGFTEFEMSGGGTQAVSLRMINAFGLGDMHGNASEWVEDCFVDNYSASQPSDGSAFAVPDCSHRVFRGGSWQDSPQFRRSASRYGLEPSRKMPSLGFRVATIPRPL